MVYPETGAVGFGDGHVAVVGEDEPEVEELLEPVELELVPPLLLLLPVPVKPLPVPLDPELAVVIVPNSTA